MAFNPNAVTRWFLRYSVTGDEHVFQCRTTPTATAAQVSTAMGGLLAALADNSALYEVTILDFSRAAAGSNVRDPQSWVGDASYGSGSMPEVDSPRYLAFTGRAAGNHQVRVFVYGFLGNTPDDFRLTIGENAAIADALLALESVPNTFLTAGGDAPTWKPYANVGFNSYWQRLQRV